MVGLGIVLLIMPGIIVAIMFAFWLYPIAEGAGPINALSSSRLITKGHRWRLFFFFLMLVLVNLLGTMALVVGGLVSIPVSTLATAHAIPRARRYGRPAIAPGVMAGCSSAGA